MHELPTIYCNPVVYVRRKTTFHWLPLIAIALIAASCAIKTPSPHVLPSTAEPTGKIEAYIDDAQSDLQAATKPSTPTPIVEVYVGSAQKSLDKIKPEIKTIKSTDTQKDQAYAALTDQFDKAKLQWATDKQKMEWCGWHTLIWGRRIIITIASAIGLYLLLAFVLPSLTQLATGWVGKFFVNSLALLFHALETAGTCCVNWLKRFASYLGNKLAMKISKPNSI